MTKQQMRSYYESKVRQLAYRLGVYRQVALSLRNAHPEQRSDAHYLYQKTKDSLTYAREQLLRCQPTKKG